MSELSKRILIAVFGIPLILLLTYLGNWYFFILILIISSLAQWEFYNIQKNKDISPQIVMGLAGGILLLTCIQIKNYTFAASSILLILLIILTAEMFRKYKNVSTNIGVTILGILYIPLLLGFLLFLRSFFDKKFTDFNNPGFTFILFLFAAIWICDTFAYFFGKKYGKHKLFKKVSPNKTIEGAVAGLVGSTAVFIIANVSGLLPYSIHSAILLGMIIGIAGQVGDLIESWFKRDAGVKDSSDILPGHGGILDRFDSLLFISPVIFILIYFIIN